MSVLQAEVDEAFRSIDGPDTALKVDMAVFERRVGFVLAMTVAIPFKPFGHRSPTDPACGNLARAAALA